MMLEGWAKKRRWRMSKSVQQRKTKWPPSTLAVMNPLSLELTFILKLPTKLIFDLNQLAINWNKRGNNSEWQPRIELEVFQDRVMVEVKSIDTAVCHPLNHEENIMFLFNEWNLKYYWLVAYDKFDHIILYDTKKLYIKLYSSFNGLNNKTS